MGAYIKGAWNGLPPTGRTIVLVVLLILVGVILSLTMYWRYDWTPIVELFGG